jgi:3-(3-hydroxy-phenyl)propionate hydroxylase
VSADPVVIVGGGPVGLAAALALAEEGVPVRVFDANAGVVEALRASTFHPPTLDMLDRYGIADELITQGLRCPSWQIRMHPDGENVVFDLGVLAGDTRHPYRLQCEQWKLSHALLARLRHHAGADVCFNAEVTGLTQDDAGVRLAVQRDGRTEAVTAPWVIGADGARSTVREAAGIAFQGSTYPETTLLATTHFPFHEHLAGLSNVNYCWKAGGGTFSLLRLPDAWRCSFYPREGESPDDALSDAALRTHLEEITPAAGAWPVLARRPYRIHQRIAARYRAGRVLLAGDAAHLNSPSGGMGMNGGLHDAFDLAARLARVWRGADAALLDGYERCRRPIALEEIIAQADTNRARMREQDPAKRRVALAHLQAIAADRTRLREHLLRTSMIAGLRRGEQLQ